MASKLSSSNLLRYSLFLLGGGALSYSLLTGTLWVAVVATVSILCGVVLHLIEQKIVRDRCYIMLEAVRNKDYSFRMPVRSYTGMDRSLNDAINQFGQIILAQQKEAQQQELFYQKIMESVTSGIIILNDAGEIVNSNKAMSQLLELPAITNKKQLSRLDSSLIEEMSTIKGGERKQLEVKTCSGMTNLSISCVKTVLHNEEVKILIFTDIRKEIRNTEVDTWIKLTRVLTHEIMNSIAPIASISDIFMKREDVIHSDLYNGIKAIHETSRGLISFVDGYRKFSSLQKPDPKPFELADLIEQVQSLDIIPERIKFEKDIVPKNMMLFADPNLIRQVLINLFKNAVEAIGDHDGVIEVRAFLTKEEHVMIYVSNSGKPIPAELAEDIFVPFFTTKKDGNGIGLSLCKQIMGASNGDIVLLRPNGEGYRTTFLLEFE